MRRTRRALVLALLGAVACKSHDTTTLPPHGQLLIYDDTDAPLPAAAGDALGPDDPAPLFDRVRIEIYEPNGTAPCDGCTHEFDLDRTIVGEGRASVGVSTPPGVAGYRARVRMFRAIAVELNEPRQDATVEVVAALPVIAAEGVTPVTVMLRTDDVAHPVGSLASPVAPIAGPAQPGVAGTWPGAARVPCVGPAPAGSVCVPGGAYWMGHPLTKFFSAPGDDLVMRVAVVSPFFLDATEVTVAPFRRASVANAQDPISNGNFNLCTFTSTPGNDEDLPVNCVSWSKARSYCERMGGDLPTEAQFQFASSARASRLYVWGDDAPACRDAVYARVTALGADPLITCPGGWLLTPRSGARDRLSLPGGDVFDLGGNVAEYALDLWNFQASSCWGPGVAHDPLCTTPADPADAVHTLLGGYWNGFAAGVAATTRQPALDFARMVASVTGRGTNFIDFNFTLATGFRCAYPATP